jgi:hypothetical protein
MSRRALISLSSSLRNVNSSLAPLQTCGFSTSARVAG